MAQAPTIQTTLTALDRMTRDVLPREADFLDRCLRQLNPLSPQDLAVLARMAQHYLPPRHAQAVRRQLAQEARCVPTM